MYAIMLMRKAKSWFTGYNSNVPGHEQGKIRYLVYNGGTPKYVAAINDVAQKGYEGIVFDAEARASARVRDRRRMRLRKGRRALAAAFCRSAGSRNSRECSV